mmetsp:Transcript_132408/g.229659  ORF Transcript_132408/g.229659 Transcript_132408/m.229659 type:complete len:353 (-) Transcript_132408:491-1549(-)
MTSRVVYNEYVPTKDKTELQTAADVEAHLTAVYARIEPSGKIKKAPMKQMTQDKQDSTVHRLTTLSTEQSKAKRISLQEHYRQLIPCPQNKTSAKVSRPSKKKTDSDDDGFDSSALSASKPGSVLCAVPSKQASAGIDNGAPSAATRLRPLTELSSEAGPPNMYMYDSHQDEHLWSYWRKKALRKKSAHHKGRLLSENIPPPKKTPLRRGGRDPKFTATSVPAAAFVRPASQMAAEDTPNQDWDPEGYSAAKKKSRAPAAQEPQNVDGDGNKGVPCLSSEPSKPSNDDVSHRSHRSRSGSSSSHDSHRSQSTSSSSSSSRSSSYSSGGSGSGSSSSGSALSLSSSDSSGNGQ